MISPFGLTGCLINLIIGGICIFVRQRRAGRIWLIYAAAFHLLTAIVYACVSFHQAGPELKAYLHTYGGLPVPIGIAVSGGLLPVTLLAMTDHALRPRQAIALCIVLAAIVILAAWLTQPFYAYLLAHGAEVVAMLLSGVALMRGPTAFYRLTGVSFLGRGVYSIAIIYMASHGSPGWAYETAVTLNLVFICLTGLGFILIELDDARARIAEADLAKTMFIANMSHELRTPLNAVIGFSEMIENDRFALPIERCRDYATNILVSARHLLSIINQLLDMASIEARREKLVQENVSLDDIITGCLNMLSGEAAAKGVSLQVEKPNHVTTLHADQRALRQIILSLTGNAVKFSSSGSMVKLSLNAAPTDDVISLAIRDDGPGIDAAHIQKIFEPFWQARNPYTRTEGGVGLGLAIARNLARNLGGNIKVESVLGRGSTFIVILPRQMSPGGKTGPSRRRAKQQPSSAE